METREVDEKLAALTAEYKNSLLEKHHNISDLKQQLEQSSWEDTTHLHQLYQIIHKLAGSAGSYGFDQISDAAITVDTLIKKYSGGKALEKGKIPVALDKLLLLLDLYGSERNSA